MGERKRRIRRFGARPFDAVLLDLGNVLIGIEGGRALSAWAGAAGVKADDLRRRFRLGDAYERHERGEIGDDEFFADLGRMLGIALTTEQWLAGWNALFTGEIDGVRERVARIARHVPVYVFSNTNFSHEAHWRAFYPDLLAPFRELYTSCALGRRKPEAAAFADVVGRMGMAAPRVVFLDDLAANVTGAQNAGLQARHVPDHNSVRREMDRIAAEIST